MPVTLYGIRNCDTVKKARAWLDSHGIEHAFHDYKTAGIERALLEQWCAALGWESVLNRAGTTFRKLPAAEKENLNQTRAIALMLAQPAMIRRPVLAAADMLLAGFKPDAYARALAGGAMNG